MLLDLLPTTRFYLFTGKGGVGKTTVSCAVAVQFARAGRKVLLVSTDPASNVGQVFGQPIGAEIVSLGSALGSGHVLDAIEINPQVEAEKYREKIVGPIRGLLPPEVVASAEESLSGSCTTEVATFNRFVDFLVDSDHTQAYDHIIFDTAPTGHTLRLLELPGDWSNFIERGAGDASCLGPLSGLEKHRAQYAAAVSALNDPSTTTVSLVARPDDSSLHEAGRSLRELESVGISPKTLIINGILPDHTEAAGSDELTAGLASRQHHALMAATDIDSINQLPWIGIELCPTSVMGIEGLSALRFSTVEKPTAAPVQTHAASSLVEHILGDLGELVDAIAHQQRIVLSMGKGGVGKTLVAQAVALGLARRGLPVLLATTDPAGKLTNQDIFDGLDVEIVSIDPARVVEDYRQEVLQTKGAGLDEVGLKQLEEDLASPCTEEVAVFRAFSAVLSRVDQRFVVVDTAPTGHTLLLIDAAGSYHRELMRQSGNTGATSALDRLRDDSAFPIIVTLAESTPVQEATELAADLARADIEPRAWVANQVIDADAVHSEFLRSRAQEQQAIIESMLTPAAKGAAIYTVGLYV